MKIAFAVNLEHDPDFAHQASKTSTGPIHLSAFLHPGQRPKPTAEVSSTPQAGTSQLTVELWWIQGCCPVISINSSTPIDAPVAHEISRTDLQRVVDRALDTLGRSSQSVFDLFPGVPLVPTSIPGPAPAVPGSPVAWKRLFVESPVLDLDPAAIRQIDPSLNPPTQLLELALEANVTRLSHEFRQWSQGPANGEENEFTAWQGSGTALLHSIVGAYVALSTQKPFQRSDLDGISQSIDRLEVLHKDATSIIPVLQRSLAQQRVGSIEEERDAEDRERRLAVERQSIIDAALAKKEEQIHKLRDGFEKQKSYAYGAIGLVISVIALVPTIGALHPDSLETPYGGSVAWLAASLPLVLTFVVSFFLLVRSRTKLTAELLKLTNAHHQTVQSTQQAANQSSIPVSGNFPPTHRLGSLNRLHATAHVMEDGTTVILKDSLAKAQTHLSISLHTTILRNQLLTAGILNPSNKAGYLVFTQDHAFVSLPAATRVIKAKALTGSEWESMVPEDRTEVELSL